MNTENTISNLIKEMAAPIGSLGLLERQIRKLSQCWDKSYTTLKPCHLIFAADNGIVEAGVVRQRQEITFLQAQNMVKGIATVSCFCKYNHIPYKVIDVGINSDKSVGYDFKVAKGTKNFLEEPAMTETEYEKAFLAGQQIIKMTKQEGYNLVSFGEMGIGNTTTSSAVLHGLTGISPEFIVGYGANKAYPEIINTKRRVIAKGINLYKEKIHKPEDIIRYVGGFDIAAMCGAMIECTRQNMPFVLDGFITAVTYACACCICPETEKFSIASHLSREPGMSYALKLGNISEDDVPIRADLALGEGIGAVLLVNILSTMMYTIHHIAKISEMTAKLSAKDKIAIKS